MCLKINAGGGLIPVNLAPWINEYSCLAGPNASEHNARPISNSAGFQVPLAPLALMLHVTWTDTNFHSVWRRFRFESGFCVCCATVRCRRSSVRSGARPGLPRTAHSAGQSLSTLEQLVIANGARWMGIDRLEIASKDMSVCRSRTAKYRLQYLEAEWTPMK